MACGNTGAGDIGRDAGIIHGNEQHDPDHGKAGGFALGFCRNIQQAGESESAMDRFYSFGVFRYTGGNVVLEERLQADGRRKISMKKLVAIAIIFILSMSIVGCGGRDSDADESHSPVRPSVSEGTEASKGTEDLEDNAVTVQVSSEIEELEKGFSAVRYEGEDGFAAFLAGGGAKTDQEVVQFLVSCRMAN